MTAGISPSLTPPVVSPSRMHSPQSPCPHYKYVLWILDKIVADATGDREIGFGNHHVKPAYLDMFCHLPSPRSLGKIHRRPLFGTRCRLLAGGFRNHALSQFNGPVQRFIRSMLNINVTSTSTVIRSMFNVNVNFPR